MGIHEASVPTGDAVDVASPARPKPRSQLLRTFDDLRRGLAQHELWGTLGARDVLQRYRRSILGPFWITLSSGAMVAGLGVLYAGLFRQDITHFLPFLAAGMLLWQLISTFLTDGCTAFFGAESLIRQIPAPLSVHIYRAAWRNVIVFAHTLIVYVCVMVIFGAWPTALSWWAIPGMLLLLVNGLWVMFALALLSARFRDIPQINATLSQFLFIFTPIVWRPDFLAERAYIAEFNPFYHLIEVVRAPLLSEPVPDLSWIVVCGLAVFGWIGTILLYARYRRRVAYWV